MKGTRDEKISFVIALSFTILAAALWTFCAVEAIRAKGSLLALRYPVAFFACMSIGGAFCLVACGAWSSFSKRRTVRKQSEFVLHCPSCGASLRRVDAFCSQCGARLPKDRE